MTTRLYKHGSAVVTVRDPDAGFSVTWQHLGSIQRTLDGSMRRHYVNLKAKWEVVWSHLTSAQRSTLVAELKRYEVMRWKPPDETPVADYYVLVLDDFTIEPTEYGWTVSATIEQT